MPVRLFGVGITGVILILVICALTILFGIKLTEREKELAAINSEVGAARQQASLLSTQVSERKAALAKADAQLAATNDKLEVR